MKERIIDFYESDKTTLSYLKHFGLETHVGRPRTFINSNNGIIQMLTRGTGYGRLTMEIAKPHLECGDLVTLKGGLAMEDPLALAWYPRPEMPAYFKAIIKQFW